MEVDRPHGRGYAKDITPETAALIIQKSKFTFLLTFANPLKQRLIRQATGATKYVPNMAMSCWTATNIIGRCNANTDRLLILMTRTRLF